MNQNKNFLIYKIMWIAITASLVFFAFIGYIHLDRWETEFQIIPDNQQITFIILMLMFLFLIAAVKLPDVIFKAESMSPDLFDFSLLSFRYQNESTPAYQDRMNEYENKTDLEKSVLVFSQSYFFPFILPLILAEAAVIFGLILSIFNNSAVFLFAAIGIALLLNVKNYPRVDKLMQKFEKKYQYQKLHKSY